MVDFLGPDTLEMYFSLTVEGILSRQKSAWGENIGLDLSVREKCHF